MLNRNFIDLRNVKPIVKSTVKSTVKSKLFFSIFVFVFYFLCYQNVFSQQTIVLNTTLSPPFSTPSQTGFIDRVVAEAFERIGYKLETMRISPARALIIANSGINDGELARIAGLQNKYPNLMQVPEKIIDIEIVLFSKNNPKFVVNGWQSVASHSLAIISGWKILENNFGKLGNTIDIIKTDGPEQSFNLLVRNRVDFFAYFKLPGLVYLTEHNISAVELLSPPLVTIGSYVYLHKKHHKIVPKLNKALRDMIKEGRTDMLFSEILKPYL